MEPKIVTSWDSMPAVVEAEGETYSTRVLANKYRMMERQIQWDADCTLATVCDLAMKKSRAKCEYERQINMAQVMVDHMIEYRIDPGNSGSRPREVIQDFNCQVQDWADTWDILKKKRSSK